MDSFENISDRELAIEIGKIDMQLIVADYAYQNAWRTEMPRAARDILWDEIETLTKRRVALAEEWLRRYRASQLN